MASQVAADDAASKRNAAVESFGAVIATLQGLELDASEGDALKKMRRA